MIKFICSFWTMDVFPYLEKIWFFWPEFSPRKLFFNFLLCESPLQVCVCAVFAEVVLWSVKWVPWHMIQLFLRWLKIQISYHACGKHNVRNHLLHKFYESRDYQVFVASFWRVLSHSMTYSHSKISSERLFFLLKIDKKPAWGMLFRRKLLSEPIKAAWWPVMWMLLL